MTDTAQDDPGRTQAAPGPARALLGVSLLCALVNLPTLFSGFMQDDHAIVESNPLVRDLSSVPAIFASDYWSDAHPAVRDLYRPVTMLSFAVNGAIGGVRPFGYRLVNLALHLLVTALVLLLARRALAPSRPVADGVAPDAAGAADDAAAAPAAAVAAILFAVHPVHADVLGLVVGRAELLAAAGTLACVLLFLAARQRESGGRAGGAAPLYAASIACFAAGFLSKENAVVAPLLALLADRLLVRRAPAIRYHLASAATLALLLALRFGVLGAVGIVGTPQFADNPIVEAPFVAGRLTALGVLGRYALLLLAPTGMSVDYSYDAIPIVKGLADPWVLAGALAVLAWAAAVRWTWTRSPGTAFSVAWIGVALLPTSNLFVLIGTIMAERLLYLPSVGFCLAAAVAIERLRARLAAGAPARARAVAAEALVPAIVLALVTRTEVRLVDWRDEYRLYASALAVAPDSFKVQYSYGVEAAERGDLEAARQAHERSIAIWPEYDPAHWNLGYVLLRLGREAEAREALRRAVALNPASFEAHLNLGVAELSLGDPAAAARASRRARDLRPREPAPWLNLGLALAASGEQAKARAALERAAALDQAGAVMDARARALLEDLRDAGAP